MLRVSEHAESQGLLRRSHKADAYLGVWVWSLQERSSVMSHNHGNEVWIIQGETVEGNQNRPRGSEWS